MRSLISLGAAVAALAASAPAAAEPVVAVTDPTPGQSFSGEYADGSADGTGTSHQQGYVGVYEGGVVACNGNPGLSLPSQGPLVGYAWVGPELRSDNPTAETPGGEAGVGNDSKDPDGAPSGAAPCPDGDPNGVNE